MGEEVLHPGLVLEDKKGDNVTLGGEIRRGVKLVIEAHVPAELCRSGDMQLIGRLILRDKNIPEVWSARFASDIPTAPPRPNGRIMAAQKFIHCRNGCSIRCGEIGT